ncbi:MAG: helix-turn-helix domain-containing protein [Thermomicrobiales bacterium]|nr:helix-turn-helix domain-containing protein [Thermomicrobiales bacterium]
MLFPDDQSPISELLHRDHYTPDELARLLDLSPEVVRHEVRVGRLKAYIIDHRVIDIRRPDVIDWLDRRHTELIDMLQRGASEPATSHSSED